MNMMHKKIWQHSITTFLLFITGCTNAMSKNAIKFEWEATESAPKHYPMEIIKGIFIFHGETEKGLYIPSGGTLNAGWGYPISSHSSGGKPMPLPDRLKIIFFSFGEKQFYKGEFELPYEKILTLFREGVSANKENPTYRRMMVGVAPGGTVTVWLTGINTKEVFFGQAQKVELNPSVAFGLPFESEEQKNTYLAKQLVNVLNPEELESLKRDGIPFGLWSRYRNLYHWIPTLTENYSSNKFSVIYVNGENSDLALSQDEVTDVRPVPTNIGFHTMINGKKYVYVTDFDEFEMMEAFEKIGKNKQKIRIEFNPQLPRSHTKIRMYNDKDSIELKKFTIKD
jgi:hypothetical protein